MEWKPNKLIAVLLALFTQSLGMLYLGRVKWAVFYFVVPLLVMIVEFALAAPWLKVISLGGLVFAIICAVHAYRIAALMPAMTVRPWYSCWQGLVAIYLIYLLSVLLLRAFVLEPFRMPSGSMFPTIKIGSYMVTSKYGYGNYEAFGLTLMQGEVISEVKRGELMVFKYPANPSVPYVKRVVGLPGDTLRFTNHQLTINGKPVETRKLERPPEGARAEDELLYVTETLDDRSYTVVYHRGRPGFPFEVTVPEKSYFVLGDNRDNSRDSRAFGPVPADNLIGKVIYVTSNGSPRAAIAAGESGPFGAGYRTIKMLACWYEKGIYPAVICRGLYTGNQG